ncbi:MAG: hypothetical protein RL354_2335, partial [Planctomycetota bacterium]
MKKARSRQSLRPSPSGGKGDGVITPQLMQDTTADARVKVCPDSGSPIARIMTHPQPPQMLTRTFRLAASPLAADASSDNGLVEGCRQAGLAAIGELEVRVVGAPDETGYLVDITVLDRALRSTAPALFREALRAEFESGRPTDVPSLLRQIARTAQAQLVPSSHATLTELAYRPSPHRSVTIRLERPASADARIDKDPSIMLTDAHARAACAL